MLTFRNTTIFFIVLLVALIGYHWQHDLPFFIYPVVLLAWSLLLFRGSYYVGSQFYIKTICAAATSQKVIAISFDDGPLPDYTPQVLQVLQEHQVPAAFFCIGNRVLEHPGLFKQVHEQGHIIGNHSYSHATWFSLYSSTKMHADLQQMDTAMQEVLGLKPRLFRPPYGVTNPNLAKAIRKGGYIPVGWNVRSLDTVIKDSDKLLQKVVKGVRPGAVVLFHDTSKATLHMLPAFIAHVRGAGYEIVRLDKMLNLSAYA
jgi:peptidoglycan/xylan/chitin deacetylase (PgdA/CDA1 family)